MEALRRDDIPKVILGDSHDIQGPYQMASLLDPDALLPDKMIMHINIH